jgi:hypothetical protein
MFTERMNSEYLFNKKIFGENKTMPAEYEKQILTALSYFPELRKTKIPFHSSKRQFWCY